MQNTLTPIEINVMASELVAKCNLSQEEAVSAVTSISNNDDLEDGVYTKLFDMYCLNGEMPYGTAKARDGDPMEWVSNKVAGIINARTY